MNEQHWQVATAIAKALQQHKTDVNELKKLVSYLRWWQNRQPDGEVHHLGNHLVDYLHNLVINGEERSQQTKGYYQTLEKVCQDNPELFATDIDTAIQTLGWAARLAVYYKYDSQPNEQTLEDKKSTSRGSKTSMAAAFERVKRP